MTNLLEHATTWHQAGYTPVPITTDGQKRPIGKWAHLQNTRPTLESVQAAFRVDTDGIGLITGGPTNLVMLEVEARAITLAADIATTLDDHGHGELWERINTGYVETSPTGGIHWYMRITDAPAARNTRLARNPAGEVLIETRGQGGFTVIAPSHGRTHPTGKPWTVLTGSPDTVPAITGQEQDALLAIIATLDQTPPTQPPAAATSFGAAARGTRPGDDYNRRTTWEQLLTPHGWTKTRHFGNNTYGWTRPGKHPRDGISATTGRNDGDNLYVFTSSTAFEPEKPYSKFAAYTLLEHGGDWAAAAKALAAKGYGTPPPEPHRPAPITTPDTRSPLATVHNLPYPDTRPLKIVDERTPERSDDANALTLIDRFGDRLRYVPQRGRWIAWNGARWEWCPSSGGVAREYAKRVARALPETDTKDINHKKHSLSARGTSALLQQAETDERIATNIDDLDNRPYELNTPGGIINLRTGTLTPADPTALHTRTTTVTPDYDAPSPIFKAFLATTFGGDQQLVEFMQRLLGQALIGTVLEQILPFAYGPGANGKTTLFEAVAEIVGTGEDGYALSLPAETIMVRKFSEHPAELAQLAGARVAIASELEDGARFAEARIKQLTGRDRINARFMRKDPFTFTPSHTLFLLGNHQPQASAGGPAFWRRIQLIPFAHVVPETDRDPMLGEKLLTEAPAILAWLAQGAANYLQHGLHPPAAVQAATAAYAHEQDTVARFIEERCTVAAHDRCAVRDLRAAYETWCLEVGEAPVTAKRFSTDMCREGAEQYRSNGVRYLRGIDLLPIEESDTADDDGYEETSRPW